MSVCVCTIGNYEQMFRITKKLFNSKFDVKDMRLIDVITRTSSSIVLFQSYYVDKILEIFSKSNTSVSRTLVDLSLHLAKNNGESVFQLEYSWVIGSLKYLIRCIRPCIAYSVSRLSRYTSNPNAYLYGAFVRY